MNRLTHIQHKFVEFIPEKIEPGTLYISKRFSTATHFCCCGCGLDVVTPLKPAKWQLIERNGSVSLIPSIGNWSFPCQSHYWIRSGRVEWAAAISKKTIAYVQAKDLADARKVSESKPRYVGEVGNWLTDAVKRVRHFLQG